MKYTKFIFHISVNNNEEFKKVKGRRKTKNMRQVELDRVEKGQREEKQKIWGKWS